MSIKILVGDALEQLRELPDESVHCVVTSPPYWGLRAYGGDAGMIGLEPTFDDHLANLVAVFCEVRRVLRGDGTLWLNYGDAYARGDRWDTGCQEGLGGRGGRIGEPLGLPRRSGYKPKDLMMMPSRVAMALQADGWWLRSEIVWQKKNPMPESVTDRPTSAHEKVFLLSKRAKYFYDAEAVRVPWMGAVKTPRYMGRHKHVIPDDKAVKSGPDVPDDFGALISRGSNLRNVWSIATFAYPGSHFATAFHQHSLSRVSRRAPARRACAGSAGRRGCVRLRSENRRKVYSGLRGSCHSIKQGRGAWCAKNVVRAWLSCKRTKREAKSFSVFWMIINVATHDRHDGFSGTCDATPKAEQQAGRRQSVQRLEHRLRMRFPARILPPFPPSLVEPCIKAGTCAKGVCTPVRGAVGTG